MTYITGVDFSSYQGSPDLDMLTSKSAFAICRHSIGSYRDSQFERNWAGIENKTVRGLYYVPHPAVSHETAKAQLRDAISRGPDLPIALDVEIAGVYVDRVYAQAMYIFQQTGKYPMIYTSPGFWGSLWGKANATHAAFFVKCPLWVAHYTNNAQPDIPKPWTTWVIWQHKIENDRAIVESYGLRYWEAKALDMNRFNGDLLDLQAFAGVGEIHPLPDPTATHVTVIARQFDGKPGWLFFRDMPTFDNPEVLAVGYGTVLELLAPEPINGLWHVKTPRGREGYVSAKYTELV